MVAQRISLSDGFEDLLGTLRGAAGDLPSEGEMSASSGADTGAAGAYGRGLGRSGRRISEQIKQLERRLQEADQKIRESISEQRATEAHAADTLRALLADLEGVTNDVSGKKAQAHPNVEKPISKNAQPGGQW